MSSEFLQTYRNHVAERAVLGIPPLPLSVKQTGEVIELLKNPPAGEEALMEPAGEMWSVVMESPNSAMMRAPLTE